MPIHKKIISWGIISLVLAAVLVSGTQQVSAQGETPRFYRNLSMGSQGQDVRILQETLSSDPSIYPAGLITGYYGQLTSQAVARYQKKVGLPASGSVDTSTVEQLNILLAQGGLTDQNQTLTITAQNFKIGDRVQTTAGLNVRTKPRIGKGSKLLGTQPAGALGTIVSGPQSGSGYIWWYVNYDSGPDGWSVENYLTLASPDTISPSTPINLTATPISSSQINLSWNPSTDNVGVTGYRVYRAGVQIATTAGTSYQNTGLAANTTYSYTVSAYDAAGNFSLQSSPVSATTFPAPAFDFSLSNGGNRSVAQGQAVSNTITATLTSGTSQAVSFSTTGLPSGATYSYSPTSCFPTCSTTLNIQTISSTPTGSYTISVSATGGSLTRATSFTLTVNPAGDITPPVTSITSPLNGATLTGIITISVSASDNVGVSRVELWKDGALFATDTLSPYSFTWDTTTAANGSHTLFSKAYDAAGNVGTSPTITVNVSNTTSDITPPSMPTGLAANPVSSSQINLSWNPSTDNVGVTGYRVYRGGVQIATTAGTSYQNTGLAANTTYTYMVAAYDAAGNVSAQSASASATTLPASADTTPPTTPTSFGVRAPLQNLNCHALDAFWGASTDTGGSGLKGYKVYRNGVFAFMVAGTNFSDFNLVPNTIYTYQLSAIDNAGNESPKTIFKTATTLICTSTDNTPPSVPTGLTIYLFNYYDQTSIIWTASTDTGGAGLWGYQVWRDNILVKPNTYDGNRIYLDYTVKAGTTYCYTVAAVDYAGNASALSAPYCLTTPPLSDVPLAPSNFTAIPISPTTINFAWQDNSNNEDGFEVQRPSVTFWGNLGRTSTNVTSFSRSDFTANTTYTFRVGAFSYAGYTYSNQVTVTTPGYTDTTPPSVPTNFHITKTGCHNIELAWDKSVDNTGGSGLWWYKMYRDGVLATTFRATLDNNSGGVYLARTWYLDLSVQPNTSHTYAISAVDLNGNESAKSPPISASTTASCPASPFTDTVIYNQAGPNFEPQGNGSISAIYYVDYANPGTSKIFFRDTFGNTSTVAFPISPCGDGNPAAHFEFVQERNELYFSCNKSTNDSTPAVKRYTLSGSPLPTTAVFADSFPLGDGDSFSPVISKLKSGGLVAVWRNRSTSPDGYVQDGVAYRNPSGIWSTIFPIKINLPSVGGYIAQIVQHPADGSIWVFSNFDNQRDVTALHFTEISSGLRLDWSTGYFLQDRGLNDIGVDGEYPPILAMPDPLRNTIILGYMNTKRLNYYDTVHVDFCVGICVSDVTLLGINANGTVVSQLFSPTKAGVYHPFGVVLQGSDIWLIYQPLDQSDFTLDDMYAQKYSNGTWGDYVYLGYPGVCTNNKLKECDYISNNRDKPEFTNLYSNGPTTYSKTLHYFRLAP